MVTLFLSCLCVCVCLLPTETITIAFELLEIGTYLDLISGMLTQLMKSFQMTFYRNGDLFAKNSNDINLVFVGLSFVFTLVAISVLMTRGMEL